MTAGANTDKEQLAPRTGHNLSYQCSSALWPGDPGASSPPPGPPAHARLASGQPMPPVAAVGPRPAHALHDCPGCGAVQPQPCVPVAVHRQHGVLRVAHGHCGVRAHAGGNEDIYTTA
jgi:hypothetical protein